MPDDLDDRADDRADDGSADPALETPHESDREPAGPASLAGDAGKALGATYRMYELIGSGGMGAVYRGQNVAGDPVAIKLLRPELATDPQMVTRFLQERAILTGLTHPNIVHVRDLVAEGDTLAIVMDLIAGPDLRHELTRRRTLPPAEAASLTASVARGLAAVHAAGVIHRDIKPENVLLERVSPDGPSVPRLTDFGVARIANTSATVRQTTLIGTPLYMAPELVEEREPTVASDLYALGIMLYEMVAGVTPFAGGSFMSTLAKHVNEAPGKPAGVPPPLWEIIAALLAKDPAARPGTAALVATSLEVAALEVAGLPAATPLLVPPPPDPDGATAKVPLVPTVSDASVGATARRVSRRALIVGAAILAVILAGGGGALALLGGHAEAASVASGTADTGTPAVSITSSSDSSTGAASDPSTTDSAAVTSTDAATSDATGTATAGSVMPDVKGKPLDAAIAAIAATGLAYQIQETPSTSAADGTVVDQSPAAGDALAAPIVITVARTPTVVYLADQTAVAGGAQSPPFNSNGVSYIHGLVLSGYNCGSQGVVEYDLGRRYTRLNTMVGLTDDSTSDERVAADITVDGKVVWSAKFGLGQPQKVDLNITGGLRLAIHVAALSSDACNANLSLGLGDPQLTGLATPTATPSGS